MAYRKSLDFLPQVFQTETNSKLLNATLDQLISEPEIRRFDGYIGRKFNPALTPSDSYIQEDFAERQNYQLEPSSIVEDEDGNINFVSTYIDLLNRINNLGGITNNPDRLFSADQYTYSGLFDFDKFANFSSYYWLPNGPDSVPVFSTEIPYNLDISVTSPANSNVIDDRFDTTGFDGIGYAVQENPIVNLRSTGYQFSTNNNEYNPVIKLARGGTYRFNVNQPGRSFFIQSEPGTGIYSWQQNLNTRNVLGVENNGEDVGTIVFDVPTKNAQDFYLNLDTQDTVNLVAHSYLKRRHLKYTEVQNANYTLLVQQNFGIDGQRFLDGKTITFIKDLSINRVPQPWQAKTFYREGDLVVYANTIYRVLSDYTTGRIFSFNNNLEIYDLEDHWYDPALFDDTALGFDGSNFDRGDTVPLENRLGWFRIAIDSEGIVRLTPADSVDVNKKIDIGEGIQYGNRSFYRTANNELELVPNITANQDFLWYQDGLDPEINGLIQLVDQDQQLEMDVDLIEGESQYTSPNGVVFENGLKIKFIDDVKQESYRNREFYVEGVGESIKLVSVDDLQTPEDWLETVDVQYDSTAYDAEGFDQSQPAPVQKQYIAIKRNSQECSAWTRHNRWFHENVIINTSSYNNYTPVIDQTARAKRPIIEFDPNIQLYNFGKKFVDTITALDSQELDALSNVEGVAVEANEDGSISTFYSDDVALVSGSTVVFAADTELDVRNKIWRVDWITPESNQNNRLATFTGDGVTSSFDLNFDVLSPVRLTVLINGLLASNAGYQWSITGQIISFDTAPPDQTDITIYYNFGKQIHLVPIHTANDGDVVTVTIGRQNQGTNWFWNGENWILAQKKTYTNQPPVFDLFDTDGISIADSSAYPSSNFAGNKIFSYKIGTGQTDTELNLKLSYRNLGNVGDIVFLDYINDDTFSYELNQTSETLPTKRFNLAKNSIDGSRVFLNQWIKTQAKSRQFQTETFFATQYQKNLFRLNTYPDRLLPEFIIVYKNNLPLTIDQYDIEIIEKVGYLNLDFDAAVGDKIDVKIYSPRYNRNSIWEIPANLENNAKNQDITEITLGQMRNHILDTFSKTNGFEGDFQGINNTKDLGPVKQYGGKILQHAGAPHIANLFLNDSKANFVESILFNQREYARYKNKFLQLLDEKLLTDPDRISNSLDEILLELSANKNSAFPFYYTDMIPYGSNYKKLTYTVSDISIDSYYLSNVFDNDTASNRAITVYLNGTMLTYGRDYTFIPNQPLIRLNITPERPDKYTEYLTIVEDDVIEIREYTNTDGSHIPATPTKLGLYPSYRPRIIQDGYGDNYSNFIRGHDGSLTKAYGDYRDQILLEFELRIYNNIKSRYTGELFDITSNTPGAFRTTDFTKEEFDQILGSNFNSWLGANGLRLTDYTNFNSNDGFTWNYTKSVDRLDRQLMKSGGWRGIYKYYYDTDQPHLRPWEMLGYSEEPQWWRKEYGPSPYTSGNRVLWNDLEAGRIKDTDTPRIDLRFARPGLSQIIPVDASGNILAPFQAISANNSVDYEGEFKFGDQGPVETAWRQSSDYPFAVQLAMALTKPSEYFGLLRDTNRQQKVVYDKEENSQWNFRDVNVRNAVEYVHAENISNQIKRVNGYTVWLSDYVIGLSLDPAESIGKKLRNLDIRLAYKLGGFSDKKYLKVYADQATPNSTNGSVVIPDDDYDIKMIKSSPRQSLTYSGVIITKTGFGWSVQGYDRNRPFFTVESSRIGSTRRRIKIGKEAFEVGVESSGRTYTVPYGTELASKFDVIDFLIGLGRYLQSQGFRFEEKLDPDNRYKNDWFLAAREFLLWSQQGWESNVAITVSPIGSKLVYRSNRGAVDAISNRPFNSRILNNNFEIIDPANYTVDRDGRNFSITTTTNNGIYLADIDVVDYEHVLVFNNTTRFNDVIYQPENGNRQYRLRVAGFKSGAWDGTYSAPGFIINNNTVPNWLSGKNYYKGEIVKFKDKYYTALKNIAGTREFDYTNWSITEYDKINNTLLPNITNKVGQTKKFYDFNESNLELDADRLAKGLVGFAPKSYLDNLGINDVSQVKFYQGVISQKGSINSIDKMVRAKLDNFNGTVDFYEQWAIRDGIYGSYDNNNQIRIPVTDSNGLKNPILIDLIDNNDTAISGRNSVREKDLISYPVPYNKNFLSYRDEKYSSYDLPSAGFVQDNEVDYKAARIDNVRNLIDKTQLAEGTRVWVAQNQQNDWSVFRLSQTDYKVDTISVDVTGIASITTFSSHDLKVEDYVYIRAAANTNFTGVYQVVSVTDAREFSVQTTFNQVGSPAGVDASIFKLIDMRIENPADLETIIPTRGWKDGDQFYLDNADDNGWGVFERTAVYTNLNRYQDSEGAINDAFGSAVASSRNNNYLLIGSPNANKVQVYQKLVSGVLGEGVEVADPSPDVTDFGTTISASSVGYVAVGSPQSDNIGFVHILKQNQENQFVLDQAIAPITVNLGGEFGYSIALSDDAAWLYVGQPGLDEGYIWVYQLITYNREDTQTFIGDNAATVFTLTGSAANPPSINSLKIKYKQQLLVPYRDYLLSGNNIIFLFTPEEDEINVYYGDYYEFVTAATLGETNGERFGHSLATTNNGSQLIIGSPGALDDSSMLESGRVYVIERTVENQFSDGVSTTYYSDLTVFGQPRVKIDDVTISSSEYTFDGVNEIVFDFVPESGSVITIESNNPILSEVFSASDTSEKQSNAQFGYALDLCPNNCSLYVGAPYYDDISIDNGRVYRYVNQGRLFGKVVGTIENPTLSENASIQINNFTVAFSSGDSLSDIVQTINLVGIPGVTALSVGDVLTIETNSLIFANKLNLVSLTGSFFDDVGIVLYYYEQTIKSPSLEDFGNFGKTVKVSPDALTLVVGSDRISTTISTSFDDETTTFDTGNTQFLSTRKQSGAVFVYDFISGTNSSVTQPGYFVFSEQLSASDIQADDQFGYAIDISNNTIYVGAPGNDYNDIGNSGLVYGFVNTTGNKSWNKIRSQSPKVDINLINSLYLYNQKTNQKIVDLDFIDPFKGKISGIAAQEISYQTGIDPAHYSNVTTLNGELTTQSFVWGSEHVGELWWDISRTRWAEYEQDSLEYRAANWGFAFPGSRIICLEWTESDVPPASYSDPQNPNARPLNTTDFNEFVVYNEATKVFTSKYYFWVIGKTRRPRNNPNRRLSAVQVEELIANPKSSGLPFAAIIDSNSVVLYNIDDLVESFPDGDDTVLVIDYDIVANTNLIHSEYELIAEGDLDSNISDKLRVKLFDSLAGEDSQGNAVPDRSLRDFNRYGTAYRPRQTMFKNRRQALKECVAYLNQFLIDIPVVYQKNINNLVAIEPYPQDFEYNEAVETYTELTYLDISILPIGYLVLVKTDETVRNRWVLYRVAAGNKWEKSRIQSYNNSRYVEIVDWVDAEVNVPDSIDRSVNFEYNLQELTVDIGDFVTVQDDGTGNSKVVQKQSLGWKTVKQQNATVQISESIWKTEINRQGWDLDGFGLQFFDEWPSIEIRNICNAIYNDIFVENLLDRRNLWITHMFKYIISEQQYIDWLFKSSFIKVIQKQAGLVPLPVYQPGNQDLIKEYIEEIKPYHTKINEFIVDYNGLDLLEPDVTDFDLPAYYNFSTNTYRSPTGTTVEDDVILDFYPYTAWRDNHTLELQDILVYATGENYFIPPEIIIEGGGGTGASARAVVSNGRLVDIQILNKGTGFVTTPFVYADDQSGGVGAILVPVMGNNKVRSFDTTIKFDRISTGGGYLISYKDQFGLPVDIRNERISRLSSEAGVIDHTINFLSLGSWVVDTEDESKVFPVENVPDFRIFNDTSGRIQFLDRRDTRGWTVELLQSYIRVFGTALTGIDLTGTTVVNDGSMTSYVPSLLPWIANFTYYQNEIIVYQNKLYKVAQQFTSASSQFDSTYLENYSGSDLESHLDRTWAFYQPTDGMLGKDLSQLFDGVAFPGVNVIGANFNQNPGFDVGAFDTKGFDSVVIGPEGVPVLDPGVLDQTLYSEFLDTTLGTKPEDIITRGAGFVDQYSSHAPEEMVPGRVYDSVAIKVQTNTVDELDGTLTTYSPEIIKTGYTTDGVTKRFAFNRQLIGDYFLVTLEKAGPRYRHPTDAGQQLAVGYTNGSFYDISIKNSYTIDWATDEIVFNIAPAANDVLNIINIGQIGEDLVANQTFTGDGSSIRFAVNVDETLIGTSLVLINGVEIAQDQYFFKSRNTWATDIVFDNPPPDNSHIYVVISSNSIQDRISKVYTQTDLINDSNRTVELDEFIRYDRSKDTTMIVELNGIRLRPGNTNYYIGDASTSVFDLPTSAGEIYNTLTFADVQVWKDGIRQDLTQYYLSTPDGSTIPTVTFYDVPDIGSDISITYVAEAEYFYSSDNTLRILESVNIPTDSMLAITSFSSHDTYKLKTKVFIGNQENIVTSTVALGYDQGGFDDFAFDTESSVDLIKLDYQIDVDQNDANRIFVTLNGDRLYGNSDYVLNNGSIEFAETITITESSVLVITWMTSNIYVKPTTFQIFHDMNGNVSYNRLTVEESTELAKNLKINDSEIYVIDGSVLEEPSIETNTPGVIFINGERITYYAKDGNVLSQLRRATGGTGAVAEHNIGSVVFNVGKSTEIDNANNQVWYDNGVLAASNGRSLQSANTVQAKFLKEKTGFVITGAPGGVYTFDAVYIEAGYVEDGYVEFG